MTEPGVRKQMSMEETNDITSTIEKNYSCVIKKEIQPGKIPDMSKEAVVTKSSVEVEVDGAARAGATGKSTMSLPYNSMSFVNDKEVKMAFGGKITIVVGDLAHQQVPTFFSESYCPILIGIEHVSQALVFSLA